jgi:(p)ppGpp synthase/HD superfamily hydrolase
MKKITGVLHDTIEDTDMTAQQLLREGFPQHIVDAIVILSKDRWTKYVDYIMTVKENELARTVKIIDMRDNSDLFRLHEVEAKHMKMIKKYHWGMKQLRDDSKYLTSYL